MLAHPTPKQIELLNQNQLDEQEAKLIYSHLNACPACQEECEVNVRNQAWEEDLRDAVKGVTTNRWPPFSAEEQLQSIGIQESQAIEGYTITFPEIGQGGQGVVYEAVQDFPHRKVAIKFLREGQYASTTTKKRFEREIAIAAMLRHPNIVTIHESGVTSDGRRYCAMEYIRGQTLTDYVRERRLSIADALELFVTVCEAANYAHQRGVMHRDLKPSNILVDTDGNVKVLDFGLARLVTDLSAEVSRTGQIVGAPAYLSPEQTRGNPDEIDVRTDVYSLGVILYELLTGQYPYTVDCALADLMTHIRESPPQPPSSAWTIDSGVRPDFRGAPASTIRRAKCPINKEVEAIMLVCLRKERERRYQSAGELAREIRRYLNHEPIEAKRDSTLYVLRKMAYRHRRAVMVFMVSVILIALGLFSESRRRAEHDRLVAHKIMADFVHDPARAITESAVTTKRVQGHLATICQANLWSPAFTDRVVGARSGLILQPDEFWKSVDGGALWDNGEWLELCAMPKQSRARLLASVREKAARGTARQKYVAFCLIGWFAEGKHDFVDLCRNAVTSESPPGVVSAARWAASRLGAEIAYPRSGRITPDQLSGLSFVRIPGDDDVRLGSDADDPDRWLDENGIVEVGRIDTFFLSNTEVTVAAFAEFFGDPANSDTVNQFIGPYEEQQWAQRLRSAAGRDSLAVMKILLERMGANDNTTLPQAAIGYVTLSMARSYCQWLNSRAQAVRSARRYRLPTEAEWEYASRGGSARRFCFGNDAEYTRYFAECNGDIEHYQVGQKMPNWYGLFDMHGGLWELTDSRYPPEFVTDPNVRGKELFVKRGGAYHSPAVRCRSAQRNYTTADGHDFYTGFRVVMEIATQ